MSSYADMNARAIDAENRAEMAEARVRFLESAIEYAIDQIKHPNAHEHAVLLRILERCQAVLSPREESK